MLPALPNPAMDESSEPNEKQSCTEKKLAIRAYVKKLPRTGFWKMQRVRVGVVPRVKLGSVMKDYITFK